MVGAEAARSDGYGAFEQGASSVEIASGGQCATEVGETVGGIGVVRTSGCLTDGQGAFVERQCAVQVALSGQRGGKPTDAVRRARVVGAQAGLEDGQGLFVHGAGTVEIAPVEQDEAEVAETPRGVLVVAQAGLADSQGTLMGGLRTVKVALVTQRLAEVVEALRSVKMIWSQLALADCQSELVEALRGVRMIGTQVRFADGQGTFQQSMGLLKVTALPEVHASLGEQPGSGIRLDVQRLAMAGNGQCMGEQLCVDGPGPRISGVGGEHTANQANDSGCPAGAPTGVQAVADDLLQQPVHYQGMFADLDQPIAAYRSYRLINGKRVAAQLRELLDLRAEPLDEKVTGDLLRA